MPDELGLWTEEDGLTDSLHQINPRHPDRGFMYYRVSEKWNNLEAAFAAAWEKENKTRTSTHRGLGLLQALFMKSPFTVHHQVTRTERYVAATVVQWLGTNCGFSFLNSVLRSCGMYIGHLDRVYQPQPKRPPPRPPNPWEKRKVVTD